MATENEIDVKDIMRIMITTDNHLGYGEKNTIIGEDSFIAFEEVLEIAVREDVDFILLGGDLFHDAVPSQNALLKCMQLLRKYTFGDKSVNIELLSDGSQNFHCAVNASVNYEDPNLNISIPVYTIHGNHDDPSSYGGTSPLDLLSTTGLVNYFGRWTDLTKIEIMPILMRKGVTQLALYGLSHINDARLSRLFESHKVNMQTPLEDDANWFYLMVLHQNRADRGHKNYLPEVALPDFLNLIIWGHEHDCRIEPEYNSTRDFYVSQPGSTVPTSLCEGETIQKRVAILEIYKNKFQLKPIPLQTVRPFVFESINIDDISDELNLDDGNAANKIRTFAEKRIDSMLAKANELITGDPRQPTLPLLRLRLQYSKEEHMFNSIRLGQMFNKKIANPSDVIHFKRLGKKITSDKPQLDQLNDKICNLDHKSVNNVEELIFNYFENADDHNTALKILSANVITELCNQLVHRYDVNGADHLLRCYKSKALDFLIENMINENNLDEALSTFQKSITDNEIEDMLNQKQTNKTTAEIGSDKSSNKNHDIECNTNRNDGNIDNVNESSPTKTRRRAQNQNSSNLTTSCPKSRNITRQTTSSNSTKSTGRLDKSTHHNAFISLATNRPKRAQQPSIVEISDDST